MKKLLYIFAVCSLVWASSCTKEDIVEPTPPPTKQQDTTTVDTTVVINLNPEITFGPGPIMRVFAGDHVSFTVNVKRNETTEAELVNLKLERIIGAVDILVVNHAIPKGNIEYSWQPSFEVTEEKTTNYFRVTLKDSSGRTDTMMFEIETI